MLVRVKHPDPNARTSLAESGPDSGGGFMINMDRLPTAKAMGWVVAHTDELVPPAQPAAPVVEDAPVARQPKPSKLSKKDASEV